MRRWFVETKEQGKDENEDVLEVLEEMSHEHAYLHFLLSTSISTAYIITSQGNQTHCTYNRHISSIAGTFMSQERHLNISSGLKKRVLFHYRYKKTSPIFKI